MKPGRYVTAAGSVVVISGETGGKFDVDFDWSAEQDEFGRLLRARVLSHQRRAPMTSVKGACQDCKFNPIPDERWLTWSCDYCGGGKAELRLDVVTIEIPREDLVPALHVLGAKHHKQAEKEGQ